MRNQIHHPTEVSKAEIVALKSFGITDTEISSYLGISHDTLAKYYRHELDTGLIRANAAVAKKLYKKAVEDEDMTAIIFWLKTRARWRTEDSISLTDSNSELTKEIKELRAKLDSQNKKEF